MAACLKLVTLLFLISSLISLSSVEARDSQFFSKEVRNPDVAAKEDPKEIPEATPAASTLDSETNNGYGLYGREGIYKQDLNNYFNKVGEDVNRQEFTSNNNYNNDNYDKKFDAGVNKQEFTSNNNYDNKFDAGVHNQEFTNNNNYDNKFDEGVNNQEYFTNNKKFGEENEQFPAAEEDTNSNEFPSNDFFNNAEFTQKNNNKYDETDEQSSRYGSREANRGYQQREPSNRYAPKEYNNQQFRSNQGYPQEREHYGMSDTRLVEDGKYFFDLKNENHGSAYARKSLPESGYYGSSVRESGYYNNYKPEEQPAGEYLP